MKYLLPLWILINSRVSQGVLEWTVIRKVTDYGQNVSLFCHVSNCCPQDSGWDRYSPEQRTLFIDIKAGRSNKKYDGTVSRDGYTLIIQNLTKSDLNVSYSCVYGVTIGEVKFLLEEDVFTYISTTKPNVASGKRTFMEGQIAGLTVGVFAIAAVPIFIYAWKRRKNRQNRGVNGLQEMENFIPELSAPIGPMEISKITKSSVDIKWKAPEYGGASITRYIIEYRLADALIWTTAGNVDGTTQYFRVKNLMEGNKYHFKVTAVNKNGPGPPLQSVDTVKLNAELSAPIGPMEISNITKSSVDIEWKPPQYGGASITRYIIEYRLADALIWTTAGNVDGTTQYFRVNDLMEGNKYHFKVTAVNSNGPGPTLESVDIVKLNAKLSAPIGPMEIGNITESSVDIKWKEPEYDGGASITEYIIEYQPDDASTWTQAGKVDGTTLYFGVKDLMDGKKYHFKVTAINSEGHGPPLKSVDPVKLNAKLSAPVGPIEISNITENSVDIEWKSPEHNGGALIEDYSIEYRTDDAATWTKVGTVDGTTHNVSLKGLQEGEYYFKVTATNSKGLTSELKSEDLVKLIAVPKPVCIKSLPEADRLRFLKIMQSEEKEKRYFVKIMIVGKESAGKTSLMRKLLKDESKVETSTDGIDIVVRRCKMNIVNGKWTIEKDIPDDTVDRIQKAIIQKQNTVDKQTENMNSEVTTKVISETSETYKNSLLMEVESGNQDNVSNHSTYSSTAPSQLGCDIQNEDITNEETTYKETVSLDNVSSNKNDINSTIEKVEDTKNDNNSELNETDNEYVTSIEKVSISEANELYQHEITEQPVMPLDLLADVFATTSTSNSEYTLCGLWDFAGQKEFYCTHQAFLTSRAIYLIVADMETEIWNNQTEKKQKDEMKEKEMQNDTPFFGDIHEAEYVDFWFDNIHCYRTVDQQEGATHIEPPVIVVFTGADKYEEKHFMDSKKILLDNQLKQRIGKQKSYQHYRHKFFVSNITDSDAIFEGLRDTISEIAQSMQHWGEAVPLKWMLLERVIDIKKNSGKNFITLDDMIEIAKHPNIGMPDSMEVITFLHFQNEVGKIVFFDDIPDLIILEPQWLANAFRCLVSDRLLEIDDLKDVDKTEICADLTDLKQKGEISDLLINTLFKNKGGSEFFTQRKHLLEIMKKFDILMTIGGKSSYIMPSRLPSSSYATVCNNLGLFNDNREKTSWFCLKFEFLPPSFFNHLSVWLMSKYKPSKVGSSDVFALYKGFCVFDLNSSGCEKLLMAMSSDTIALQVVWFAGKTIDPGQISSIRKDLRKKIIDIKKKYKIEVSYEQKFNCSDLPYYIDGLSFANLKENEQVDCYHHQKPHISRRIYLPWAAECTKSLNGQKMARKHEQILQNYLEYLVGNLHNVERICEYLEVDDILIEEDLSEIKQKSEKTRALLSILPYRGNTAYSSFIDALKRTENICVADYLGQELYGWPDLVAGRKTVRKKDVKMASFEFYGKILKDRKIYQMTNASNRGKFILISNAQSIQCAEDEEEKKRKYSICLANTDFDISNMCQLLKSMGYELKGGNLIKNLKKEEIIELLKRKVYEIDSDQSAKYDSLVILFLSGKYECDAGKIYDCDGKMVKRNEILEIIKGCQHFKGKPKVVFVQTYNFQDESHNYDTTDSANDLIKDCDPNEDDIFVVTNYPRIGPWILGEDMSGSYFIQALIHVFKQFACEKSFMELLAEANMCLAQAVVPKKTTDDGKSVIEEKKTVAQIAFLECCEGKDLYFFPGIDLVPIPKGFENKDFSESGRPVCAPSSENPH